MIADKQLKEACEMYAMEELAAFEESTRDMPEHQFSERFISGMEQIFESQMKNNKDCSE